MLAEWSAECSAEDPVLIVPWHDPAGAARFIDLTHNPYDLDAIPEAAEHPPLMQALRALNASRSPLFTAKCDAWLLHSDELVNLAANLDLEPEEAAFGFGSYIDCLWRDRTIFASFHRMQQVLAHLLRRAQAIDSPHAALDCVVRPALIDFDGPREGFAVSVYVKALATHPDSARHEWANALQAVVAILRSKEMSSVRQKPALAEAASTIE